MQRRQALRNIGSWEIFSCLGQDEKNILRRLEDLPITIRVLGNWEESLWRAALRKLDTSRPSHRYLLRQCQYIMEEISLDEIEALQAFPMHTHRQFGNLKVGISHHLPDKNWGRELIHLGKQEDFDRLVTNPDCDIAIYGHIHQQFLRYGSQGQLIFKSRLNWATLLFISNV